MDYNQAGNALLAFSAGMQGQGAEFIKQLREQRKAESLAELGAALSEGKIDQAQYLKGLAQYNPDVYSKLALSQIGIDQPADVQSWLFMNKLPPDQRETFRNFRRNPQWLNTGGAFVNPNSGGNIPITPKPEDMPDFRKNQAAATASGKIEGETITGAQQGLGDFLASSENQLSIIDQMIGNKERGVPEHPGLKSAVGGISARIPSLSDKTLDFENLLEQARSGAFLDSISRMQGFGALSNEEGKAATAAATRMKALSGEEGFKKAAKEYRNIITKGIERMKNKASLTTGSPSAFAPLNEKLSDSEKVVQQAEQSAVPMPGNKAALKANTLYKTPRGVALWDGEKFIQE